MKAIVAVAASILTAPYYMLRDGDDYHDLGAAHSSAATTPASSPSSLAVCTTSATRSPSAPLHEVLGGASYLVGSITD